MTPPTPQEAEIAVTEGAMLSWDDAFAIGSKVAEMADRVKVGDRVVPGAQMKWWFTIDGTRFQVAVTVAREMPDAV